MLSVIKDAVVPGVVFVCMTVDLANAKDCFALQQGAFGEDVQEAVRLKKIWV
jgi:hypothetical protein